MDRFLLLLALGLSSFLFLFRPPLKTNVITLLLVLNVALVVLGGIIGSDPENPTFPMALYSSLVLLMVVVSAVYEKSIEKFITFSFLFYIVFTVHGMYSWLVDGTAVVTIPFSGYLPFIKHASLEHAEKISHSYGLIPRLSFPFATPPHLSIVMACFTIFFIYKKVGYQYQREKTKALWFSTLVWFSIFINITTISKSGFISLLFGLLVYAIVLKGASILKVGLKLAPMLFIALFLIVSSWGGMVEVITDRLFDTANYSTNSSDSHLSIRLRALEMFVDHGFMQQVFGVGIGNYPGLHSHMSYLTILVERGLVGFFLFLLLFIYPIFKLLQIKSKTQAEKNIVAFCSALLATLALGHVTYEFTYVIPLWVFLGLVLIKVRYLCLSREVANVVHR